MYQHELKFTDIAAARWVEFAGVADFTDFGDLVGLEILDLKRQMGPGSLPPRDRKLSRWSYDDSIDAFYARASEERSHRQETAAGRLGLSASGELVTVEFDTD